LDHLVLNDYYDFYRFTTTETGGTTSAVRLTTDQSDGRLDLYLFDAAGDFLTWSASQLPSGARVPLAGLPAGTYTVLVYGRTGANPDYALTVDPTPLDPLPPDDGYEPNNTPATAADLGAVTAGRSV